MTIAIGYVIRELELLKRKKDEKYKNLAGGGDEFSDVGGLTASQPPVTEAEATRWRNRVSQYHNDLEYNAMFRDSRGGTKEMRGRE